MTRKSISLLVALVLCAAIIVVAERSIRVIPVSLPVSETYQEFASSTRSEQVASTSPIIEATTTAESAVTNARVTTSTPPKPSARPRTEVRERNLAVPFQAQAPFANWVEPYKEACEEASLIMVDHYLRGVPLSKQEMQDEIDTQIAWQMEHWSAHADLPLEKVVELAKATYLYSIRILDPLTPTVIKAEIDKGLPVIVPSAGRELDNPNFKIPGPLYHMLVIKGYLPDGRFITNDPGTRNGADYVYSEKVLMVAIRDWDGDGPDGKTIGLVMYK